MDGTTAMTTVYHDTKINNAKVELDNVEVTYGSKVAVRSVGLQIPDRSVTAFIARRAAASRPFCARSTG